MVRLTTLEGDAGISTVPRLNGWWTDLKGVVKEKTSDAVGYTSRVFSESLTTAGKQVADKAVSEVRSTQTSVAPLTPYVEQGKQTIPTWIVVAGVGFVVYMATAGKKGARR